MKQKKFLAFVVMLLLSSFVFGERRWKEDGRKMVPGKLFPILFP